MVDAAHARELIARSIARHGGERWSRIARLTLPLPIVALDAHFDPPSVTFVRAPHGLNLS